MERPVETIPITTYIYVFLLPIFIIIIIFKYGRLNRLDR